MVSYRQKVIHQSYKKKEIKNWRKEQSSKLSFRNGHAKYQIINEELWGNGLISNVFNRDSCTDCTAGLKFQMKDSHTIPSFCLGKPK